MSDSALDVFWRKSKESEPKRTPQRTAIFQELLKAKDHPTVDDIYERIVKKIPNISFDTVNRTLLTFSKIGITKVVEGYRQVKRYDPDMGIHHHFRCLRCGRIMGFHNEDFRQQRRPRRDQERFTMTSKKVVLEGLMRHVRKELNFILRFAQQKEDNP